MEELLSVIVPVYNVEKYLRECLDSIVNQTYKNLQIILVDDGSTDGSGEICDNYANKDDRITVVHQKNRGAGAAKNAGLELIKGEYFSIVDSDDSIDLRMYEIMINYLYACDVDIVQCRFYSYYRNAKIVNEYCFKGKRKYSNKRFLFELLYDWKYSVLWNKLYKTSLLEGIRFPVGRVIDDEFFTYKLVCNAKNIQNIDEAFYCYRIRKSSVMNQNKNESMKKDRLECFEERYDYIKSRFPELADEYYHHLSSNYPDKHRPKPQSIIDKVRRKIQLMGYRYFSSELGNEFFE